MTSPCNQQRFFAKWKDSDFEEQTHWPKKAAKGKIGDAARKPLPLKKNLKEGSLWIIEQESIDILRLHSTLHLQVITG